MTAPRRVLLVVGASPPMTTGNRTRARCALAARLLSFESYRLENLLLVPTPDVLGLRHVGQDRSVWLAGRVLLAEALDHAQGVLLAYGISEPVGAARYHFRDQTAWLRDAVDKAMLPVWQVGDRPRHPSRWQRHTSRVSPGIPFPEALGGAFTRLS